MPFQAYIPGLEGFSTSDEEELARMQEARLRYEQQALPASQVEDTAFLTPAPEEPGFLSRAASNFGGALGDAALATGQEIFGLGNRAAGYLSSPLAKGVLEPIPKLASTIPGVANAAAIARDLPKLATSFAEMATPASELEKPWLDAPNKAARATALAAERLTNVKNTPEAHKAKVVADSQLAPTIQPRSVMNVTIDGKTYDYSDPNVRAPKLTGDTVNLRPRGPGAFASYYDPATKNVQVGQRLQEVATLPEKFRPGVSTMESPARTQLLEYQTRQRLGEARRGAERAEMSPREAAMLDPRVIAEQIKLMKPERLQFAMQKIAEVTGARTADEWAKKAVARALQADPALAMTYKQAQAGDTRAQADIMKRTAPLTESAIKEYNGMIISVLGSDPYKQDPMAGLSLQQPTPPGS